MGNFRCQSSSWRLCQPEEGNEGMRRSEITKLEVSWWDRCHTRTQDHRHPQTTTFIKALMETHAQKGESRGNLTKLFCHSFRLPQTGRYNRPGAKGMVCFLMTKTITKLSWQAILRQINASRFNTRRGLGGGGVSNVRNSLASFDRKPIILAALFSQANF